MRRVEIPLIVVVVASLVAGYCLGLARATSLVFQGS